VALAESRAMSRRDRLNFGWSWLLNMFAGASWYCDLVMEARNATRSSVAPLVLAATMSWGK
jgi:hypothetical protein